MLDTRDHWSCSLVTHIGHFGVRNKNNKHWSLSQSSLVAQRLKYLPAIQETRVRSLGWEDPLEKDGGGCRLQFTGSQRIGHDWATSLSLSLFKVLAIQLCPTLCDSMDCSPPESSVHRILQARVLKCVAIPFYRGSSQPSDQTQVSCITDRVFTTWATSEENKH